MHMLVLHRLLQVACLSPFLDTNACSLTPASTTWQPQCALIALYVVCMATTYKAIKLTCGCHVVLAGVRLQALVSRRGKRHGICPKPHALFAFACILSNLAMRLRDMS